VLRDLLAGETPQLVLPDPINYLAAIIGSVLYVAMAAWIGVDEVVSEWVTVALVFGLRTVALRFGLKAPEPLDLPGRITAGALTDCAPARPSADAGPSSCRSSSRACARRARRTAPGR
jgi:hypothetical protein